MGCSQDRRNHSTADHRVEPCLSCQPSKMSVIGRENQAPTSLGTTCGDGFPKPVFTELTCTFVIYIYIYIYYILHSATSFWLVLKKYTPLSLSQSLKLPTHCRLSSLANAFVSLNLISLINMFRNVMIRDCIWHSNTIQMGLTQTTRLHQT